MKNHCPHHQQGPFGPIMHCRGCRWHMVRHVGCDDPGSVICMYPDILSRKEMSL